MSWRSNYHVSSKIATTVYKSLQRQRAFLRQQLAATNAESPPTRKYDLRGMGNGREDEDGL
jgi:hypothetical protein